MYGLYAAIDQLIQPTAAQIVRRHTLLENADTLQVHYIEVERQRESRSIAKVFSLGKPLSYHRKDAIGFFALKPKSNREKCEGLTWSLVGSIWFQTKVYLAVKRMPVVIDHPINLGLLLALSGENNAHIIGALVLTHW